MIEKKTIREFLRELASKKPTPGGGSAAALSGAVAAGLLSMAAKFSEDKKTAKRSERLMKVLMGLIEEDAKAFEKVMETKGEEKALKRAAEVPLQTARYGYEILKLAEGLVKNCNPNVITDIGVAAKMAEAAVEGALLNVKVNLASIKDEEFKKEIQKAIKDLYLTGYQTRAIISRIQGKIK